MKILGLLGVVCLAGLVQLATGYSSGAPSGACQDMVPQHKVPPRDGDFPYIISVDKNSVRPGQKVKVTITGKDGLKFKGFFIQARVDNTPVGHFEKGAGIKIIDCGSGRENAATHSDAKEKQKIEVIWKSPEKLSETVTFLATVAKDGGTFWVAQQSEPIKVV